MLRNFITILFSFIFIISLAQIPKKAFKAYSSGQSELIKKRADKAIAFFNKAIAIYPSYKEAYLALHTIYIEKNDGVNALIALENATLHATKDKPNLLFNTAKLALEIGEYEKASTYSNNYLNLNSKDETTRKLAALYKIKSEYSIANKSIKVDYSPILLSSEINTKYPEYLPSLDATQETLVFTRRVNGNEDLFISKKKFNDSIWNAVISWPLNTIQNEGAHTISANGKVIVFTRCNMQDGAGGCDLYITEHINGKWSSPQNMGNRINTVAWESQPSLSTDGRELYFASTRIGGLGGSDIWKSIYRNNLWSTPINLGKTINTEWEESSPSIHADRKTIYFRSTGWPGYGSFDLFMSKLNQSNEWNEPINLGYPINDHKDQGAMVVAIDGNTAYYTDQHIGLQNQLIESNIVKFSLPMKIAAQPCLFFKGKVIDSRSNNFIANAQLYVESTNNFLKKDSILSDKQGEFLLVLPTNLSYKIYVTSGGYNFYSDRIVAEGNSTINYNVYLTKAEASDSTLFEKPIVLKNVLFKSGSSILEMESTFELNQVANYLVNHPGIHAEILGHTDNVGSQNDNKNLSIDRAYAVSQYLIQKGIESKRMTYTGYGDSQPIASNDTEDGRVQNRRVEIKLRNK